jgi:hypothetical protein
VIGCYLPRPLAGVVSHGGQPPFDVDVTVHFRESPTIVLSARLLFAGFSETSCASSARRILNLSSGLILAIVSLTHLYFLVLVVYSLVSPGKGIRRLEEGFELGVEGA